MEAGGRTTRRETRRDNGNTYASTVSCSQKAHDIGTRGEARVWALSLLPRAFCYVGYEYFEGKSCAWKRWVDRGTGRDSSGSEGRVTRHRGARWRGNLRGCVACQQSQCGLCGVDGAAAVVSACSGGMKVASWSRRSFDLLIGRACAQPNFARI
jgi:hypothetical protein